MFWLIVASAAAALIWAYFMPIEVSVAAMGQIHYMGEPQAVSAEHSGVVRQTYVKSFAHVEKGAPVISVLPDETTAGKPITVSAPGNGALIWQRGYIQGDRVQANERLAIVYPDEPLGLLIRLSDNDIRKIDTGMTVRVRLDAYPYQDYGVLYGTVSGISPTLDVNGQISTDVLVTLADVTPEMALRPGLTAVTEIITGQTTLLKQILYS